MPKRPKSLDWNGKQVSKAVIDACIQGVNETMGVAVTNAKKRPRMPFKTGKLQGGVRIIEPAHADGYFIRGSWGVGDVDYAEPQEAKRGFLRGGGGEAYPELVPRIGKSLKRRLK